MNRPVIHPRKEAVRPQFYPYTVTFKHLQRTATSNDEASGGYVNITGLVDLPCAYSAAAGGGTDTFEVEAKVGDQILLPGLYTGIRPRQIAVLNLGSAGQRWFDVVDVMPAAQGTQTLLAVEARA